ncbi:hypothetical protein R6Q59_021033 [Mikania micrantha]
MLHGLKMKCNLQDDEFVYHGHHHNSIYEQAYIYEDIDHYDDDAAIDGDDDDDDGDYDYAPAASMEGNGSNDLSIAPAK